MIPILYKSEEKDFFHNGLGLLSEALDWTVDETLNGEFEFHMVYPLVGRLFEDISEDMQIKAKPNDKDEPHIFRIYETEIDAANQTMHIYGASNVFDLLGNMVSDVIVTNATPNEAWQAIVSDAMEPISLSFHSDISTRSSTRWTRRNVLNCISGEEGSLLQYWGGEIKRGNNWLWLYKRRGRDNVTTIRHGKNLRGLSATYSKKGIVTAIVPILRQSVEGKQEDNIVIGNTVKSPYVDNYAVIYYREVEYSEEDGVIDLASLNAKAASYFIEKSGIDKPSINMKIELEDLVQTTEYERFKDFEKVELGDTITVYSEKYNIHLTAKVQRIVYNGARKKNEIIEVGTTRATQYDSYRELINDTVQPIQKEIQIVQVAANGKNKIFRGETEPVSGMSKNDLWYKPVGQGEIEFYVFDGVYWQLEKISAGLLGGTLDAENGDVNLINVNVANIVGETSDFIQSWWNGINSRININSDRFSATDTLGNSAIINPNGEFRSYSASDNTRGIFHRGRIWFYDNDDSAVLNIGAHPVTGTSGYYKGVLATARSQPLYIGRYNDYLVDNPSATVNPYISLEYAGTVGDEKSGYTRMWRNMSMNDNDIIGVGEIRGRNLAIRSSQGSLLLGAPQPDGKGYNTLEVGFANTKSNGNIDMGGYTITNQSDIRLKTNVVDSEVNALNEIERMKFIEYDWDLENPANDKKPTGRQFGIVAQYSPFLQTKASGSESYLSVDMSKQVNLNSKAIQELKKENDTLKQELADLKAILSEKELI